MKNTSCKLWLLGFSLALFSCDDQVESADKNQSILNIQSPLEGLNKSGENAQSSLSSENLKKLIGLRGKFHSLIFKEVELTKKAVLFKKLEILSPSSLSKRVKHFEDYANERRWLAENPSSQGEEKQAHIVQASDALEEVKKSIEEGFDKLYREIRNQINHQRIKTNARAQDYGIEQEVDHLRIEAEETYSSLWSLTGNFFFSQEVENREELMEESKRVTKIIEKAIGSTKAYEESVKALISEINAAQGGVQSK